VLDPRNGFASALRAACGLLVVVLAGCATDASRNAAHAPDWESPEAATVPAAALAPAVPAPTPPPPPPPTGPTNEVTDTWVSLHRWCKAKGLAAPCPLGLAPSSSYALSVTNGVFVLRTGLQLAYWNGVELRLGFAPQMIDGQPFLHTLDLKKTLQPLIGGAPMSFLRTNPTIVIDPGHGGDDAGTRSVLGNRYEREFTLDWARRLESLLATNGWQVFLTRTNDIHLSLSNRIAFAEEHQAGLFLSLHFNSAAPNEREAGLETYCLTPTGMASSVTRGYGDDPALAFPNNAFDAENLQLASWVHRALLQVNGWHDRGVRHARYLGVLRGQNRPAILVEGGYLSNPLEARRIADPAYRQRMAEAVAKALSEKTEIRSPKPQVASREPTAGTRRAQN
jgi:N-acetylmuramoyl-L-alanine amidase